MKLPTIPPGLAGKIIKYHTLSGFAGFRPLAFLEKNNNRLLTKCEGRTGEYWPSIEGTDLAALGP